MIILRILHLSTYNEVCGVSDYLKNYLISLEKLGHTNEVFPIDLTIDSVDKANIYYDKFIEKSKNYDLVHIQHTWGFWAYGNNKIQYMTSSSLVFRRILEKLSKNNCKVFVTFHSPPPFLFYSLFNKLFRKYSFDNFFTEYGNMKALVHNNNTKKQFINAGFHPKSVEKIIFPVFENNISQSINDNLKLEIKKKLEIDSKSVVISMLGFLRENKGYDDSLNVLKELPKNFKLLLVGGIHPNERNGDKYLDKIKNIIKDNSLENRVIITGLYKDEDLSTYFDLTDIILLPYGKEFKDSSGAGNLVVLSGSPIIAYDHPNLLEMNKNHETLFLVNQGDLNDLKAKIINLSENDKLRDYYINEAKLYVNDNSPLKQAKDIIKIFKYFR